MAPQPRAPHHRRTERQHLDRGDGVALSTFLSGVAQIAIRREPPASVPPRLADVLRPRASSPEKFHSDLGVFIGQYVLSLGIAWEAIDIKGDITYTYISVRL